MTSAFKILLCILQSDGQTNLSFSSLINNSRSYRWKRGTTNNHCPASRSHWRQDIHELNGCNAPKGFPSRILPCLVCVRPGIITTGPLGPQQGLGLPGPKSTVRRPPATPAGASAANTNQTMHAAPDMHRSPHRNRRFAGIRAPGTRHTGRP